MLQTTNFGINKPELNNTADIRVLTQGLDTIDKGLVLDVGDSTGSGNDYVLNIGNITLTSTSKGISFKFWADRDSTGAVTINGNYNLIKAGGGAVTNIKKDAPYVVTFDGTSNFFLASGGGADTVSFTSDKLLDGYTANDSDGNAVSGTMPERGNVTQVLTLNGTINLPEGHYNSVKVTQNITTRGATTDALSQSADSNYLYSRIPVGAYFSKSASGYPEIRNKLSDVSNALKTLPSNKEQEVINNLGGKMFFNGDKIVSKKKGESNEFTFDIGFKPTTVIAIPYYSSGGLYSLWIHIRSTDNTTLTNAWREYNSSSSSSTDLDSNVIRLTDTGFVYKDTNKSNSSGVLTEDYTLKLNILAIG